MRLATLFLLIAALMGTTACTSMVPRLYFRSLAKVGKFSTRKQARASRVSRNRAATRANKSPMTAPRSPSLPRDPRITSPTARRKL